MRLKRKWKVTACTMHCKRRWQWGEEDGRDEGVPQQDDGNDRKEWSLRRAGVEVPDQDGPRSGDDNRRAQLTARPSGTCGGVRARVERTTDQGRPVASGEKRAKAVLAKDRVRPGREAPGRLWRPAPLGRPCQEGIAMNPTEDVPARGYQPEREQLAPRSHCCLEAEWTCRCCGTVWYKKIAKDE